MRAPDGGSVPDPDRQDRPRTMWERRTAATPDQCLACKARHRPRTKRRLRVTAGPVPGDYLICPHCDGTAGAVPPSLRDT